MTTAAGYRFSLPFDEPVEQLEDQIAALRALPDADRMGEELTQLETGRDAMLRKIYSSLSAWDTVRVSRHPSRPQTRDYIKMICRDFRELHGDRQFGDDPAIVCGFGRIGQRKVMIIGHQKGSTTQEKIRCHFGCAHPEGYRKALHKMQLAEKFRLPIVCLVDTPGAYPGMKAEERGQAEAIAFNLREMSRLETPIVSCVIGEGGSGGALGIAVADRVAMLEYSWYSVISPEGCAAILWKVANDETNRSAADALHLTADQNIKNGLIDDVVPEPLGGAHRAPDRAGEALAAWIDRSLGELEDVPPATLRRHRHDKFRAMGRVGTVQGDAESA